MVAEIVMLAADVEVVKVFDAKPLAEVVPELLPRVPLVVDHVTVVPVPTGLPN